MPQNQRSNTNPEEKGEVSFRKVFWSTPLRSSFFIGIVLVIWVLCLLWAIDRTLPSSRSRSTAVAQAQNKNIYQARDRKRPEKQPEKPKKSPSEPDKKKPSPKSSKTDRPSSEERTYSFVGSVSRSVPEVQSRRNATGTAEGSSSKGSSGGKSGKGDSRSQKEGQVPELTIRVTEENIETVAARFNYQMAAMTASGDAILGKVERGTLRPIGKEELSRYARRARSARKHPEYQRLRRKVAQQVPEREAGSIQLIYLVPKSVEQRFVETQMQALRRRGISPGDVAKMMARLQGASIKITSIKRK